MGAPRGLGRDFFQAQDDARSATRWFLLLFAVCLILIVLCVYFAVTAGYFVYEHVSDAAPYETPVFDLKRAIVTVNATIWCIALAGLYKYARLARGGSYVCESLGARRVDPTTRSRLERRLLNVVEEMAIASGVPLPAVHVLDGEPGINAFAAGYELDRAAIAVTHGALEKLDRDELQAVVAHEFSHILNGDMRLNTRLIAALHGILALTIVGRALRYLIFPKKSVNPRVRRVFRWHLVVLRRLEDSLCFESQRLGQRRGADPGRDRGDRPDHDHRRDRCLLRAPDPGCGLPATRAASRCRGRAVYPPGRQGRERVEARERQRFLVECAGRRQRGAPLLR